MHTTDSATPQNRGTGSAKTKKKNAKRMEKKARAKKQNSRQDSDAASDYSISPPSSTGAVDFESYPPKETPKLPRNQRWKLLPTHMILTRSSGNKQRVTLLSLVVSRSRSRKRRSRTGKSAWPSSQTKKSSPEILWLKSSREWCVWASSQTKKSSLEII